MIGIFGIGGIGKTTIAKAIYNFFASKFEGCCFLANIRENSKRECGIVQLQETLLFEILANSNLKVGNIHRGINVIKERLCCKRALLVLDDVDQLDQLETLSGEHDWFGSGSRIIITTRDEHLLTQHGVDLRYRVQELDHNEALQLFSWNAFKSDKPADDFVELTKHALHYAGSLPLALTVLGSHLYGRNIHHWKSALQSYKRIPQKDIQEKLKISYDGLLESEQNIFLDIACFFKGEQVDYVMKILDSCGFSPNIGMTMLMDKSLISVDEKNRLVMHDLLQDMGREIVRQESPLEPGKRSRLWFHEDIRHILEENTGTNKIEGILVDLPRRDFISLSSKAFMKMRKLRLFINRNARFLGNLNYLSNELRLIDWSKCPFQFLPSNFHGRKLTVLRMRNSLFKVPKEGFKNFQNMTIVQFYQCEFLTEVPDFSGIPNLEELTLHNCKSLVEVHDSVGFLDKLVFLTLQGCSNLTSLPRSLKLRSLKWLDLGGCSSLENFPEIECKMERLRCIILDHCGIKELPSSIRYLVGLHYLYLEGCKNLVHLPSSILQLQHLESLSIHCSEPPPAPVDSSILNYGCSSEMVPALKTLKARNCVIPRSDFLMRLHCFSNWKNWIYQGVTLLVFLHASKD